MAKIIIEVSPSGDTTVKTTGYAGTTCKDASKFLEDALGDVISEKLTTEYHQKATHKNQLRGKA